MVTPESRMPLMTSTMSTISVGIEARHHLVEQQQPRAGGQRAGKLQPLAAGDGEIGAHLVELARHADGGRHRLGLALGRAAVGGMEIGADHDVLAHADLGEGLRDLERAHHARGTDPVRRQAGDVLALEGDLPASGAWKPAMAANSVVLPAPLGPIRPTISPCRTSSEAWSTALKAAERFRERAHFKHGAHSFSSSSSSFSCSSPPLGGEV